jgi:hypothetical protein
MITFMFRFGRYSFYRLLVDADADALGGHMPRTKNMRMEAYA